MNKLDKFIETGKDVLKKENNSNLIYKINYQNSSYMGQTKRKLKIRIKKHKADINKSSNLLSVISCIN